MKIDDYRALGLGSNLQSMTDLTEDQLAEQLYETYHRGVQAKYARHRWTAWQDVVASEHPTIYGWRALARKFVEAGSKL